MSNDFTKSIDSAISRVVQSLVSPAATQTVDWNKLVQALRTIRERSVAQLQNLSQEQADFAPAKGTWSIAQNADHVLLGEKLYRTQIGRLMDLARAGGKTTLEIGFDEINPSLAFIPNEVMALMAAPLTFVNRFVPGIVRETIIRYPLIPATTPSVMEPAKTRPIAELVEHMATSIAATEELFRDRVPANLRTVTMSHPLLGNNNVQDIFGLMCAHEARHQDTIKKISENRLFPAR